MMDGRYCACFLLQSDRLQKTGKTIMSVLFVVLLNTMASQVVLPVNNLPANEGNVRDRFHRWVRNIPWRRAWQSTPVFLPGESHRQRNLVGYSLWGHKESDMTEQLTVVLLCQKTYRFDPK